MTGLSRDTVLRACADRKWVLSEDGATVNPTPPTQPAPLHTSSEDQFCSKNTMRTKRALIIKNENTEESLNSLRSFVIRS
ncbi:hypothetical protein MSG28_002274 [Choristoneura fumiferana]|uniref:Uncharacterized protein n=1 Tax=Choristoneura fumiferana TaxID=7141 RepID=A0ACC0JUR2_CHOFU|nr:hypothetical protein MSG28_002274 [Choristoneura fumiferana]